MLSRLANRLPARPHLALPSAARTVRARLIAGLLCGVVASTVLAQTARVLPADAKRGQLTVTSNTTATVEDRMLRFAPGLRILSQENRLLKPQQLADQTLAVRYKLDLYGQLLTVWILTDEERRRDTP